MIKYLFKVLKGRECLQYITSISTNTILSFITSSLLANLATRSSTVQHYNLYHSLSLLTRAGVFNLQGMGSNPLNPI